MQAEQALPIKDAQAAIAFRSQAFRPVAAAAELILLAEMVQARKVVLAALVSPAILQGHLCNGAAEEAEALRTHRVVLVAQAAAVLVRLLVVRLALSTVAEEAEAVDFLRMAD